MWMRESDLYDLKNELERFVKDYGAYAMRVADASKGFENAVSGCRPKDVMKNCNSVVVFAIYVGSDYYRTLKIENKITGDDRIMHIFRDWLQYKVAEYLLQKGHSATVPTGYFNREKLIPCFPSKLAAYEAGLGVYGRCGIIITPEYGPRVNFGVVLTDANLEPDEKLTDFNPCLECRLCVDLCPPKAIREDVSPPMGHDRDRCINFVLKLREKTRDQHFYCGYCYDSCPVGKTDSPGFRLSRYKNLLDLAVEEREHLIKGAVESVS
jgi:epoxyqueuosine reductase QueG